MLVLSRKKDQQIAVGSDVKITVLKLEKGRVKLGIEAPDSVRITRPEVHGIPQVGDHGPKFKTVELETATL